MKVCVVGLGYIGLPTAAIFSKHGADVVGIDISSEVVDSLNKGIIHIEEPGLDKLVQQVIQTGKFRASTSVEEADVYIVAVPTPNNKDKYKSCDLTYVLEATKSIIPFLKKGNVVIIESTIAPRTMEDYIKPLVEGAGYTVGSDLYLVHCPERVLPGKILHELSNNNRIVGGVTKACSSAGAEVYSLFVKGEIIETDAKTAEMTKLMENTFRDVNIALANELTQICNELEINVLDVIEMANKHPRVNIHSPGPGVGGHCLAVDPHFIVAKSPENANIIKLARDTNEDMPNFVVNHMKKLISDKQNPKIAAFGVTYKANVDDMRESPAMEVITKLVIEGYNIAVHDPHIKNDELQFVSVIDAVKNADLVVILTDHDEFENLDYDLLAREMKTPMLLDTRNCINPNNYAEMKVVNFGNLYKYMNEDVVVR